MAADERADMEAGMLPVRALSARSKTEREGRADQTEGSLGREPSSMKPRS